MKNRPINVVLFLLCCSLFLTSTAFSSDTTSPPMDMVGFFKKAVNSPPDIERIIFKDQNFGHPGISPDQAASLASMGVDPNKPLPPQFFEGARAGSNFFLSAMVNSNDLQKAMEPGPLQINVDARFIIGRVGSNSYKVGAKELRTTTEGIWEADGNPHANLPTWESQADYVYFNQIVEMGVGSLKEHTAIWANNEFTAEREGYAPIHGELIMSNNLPFVLKVSEQSSVEPFEIIRYVYPDPPDLLGGYPEKIIRSNMVKGQTLRAEEYDILKIQIALHSLAENYFAAAKFVTDNILFTNSYSNGATYTISFGEMHKNSPFQVPDSPPSRKSRIPAIVWSAVIIIGLLLFFFRNRLARNKS